MSIKTVGVVGAGSMGAGIANVFALNGYNVVLRDIEERFVQGGLDRIDKFMSKSVQKGKNDRGSETRSTCSYYINN